MPYPNEHSCRLNDPANYEKYRRVNSSGKSPDKIFGKKKGSDKWELQSLRYPTSKFSKAAAAASCKRNGGSFEAASGGKDEADVKMATLSERVQFIESGLDIEQKNRAVSLAGIPVELSPGGEQDRVVLIKSGMTAHRIGGKEEENTAWNLFYPGKILKKCVSAFNDIPMYMDHPDMGFLSGRPRKSEELAGWYSNAEFVRTPDRDCDADPESGAIIAKPNFFSESRNGKLVQEVMSKKPEMLEISIYHTGDFKVDKDLGCRSCEDIDWCISADIVPLGAAGGNLTGKANEVVVKEADGVIDGESDAVKRVESKQTEGENKSMNISEIKAVLADLTEVKEILRPQIEAEIRAQIAKEVAAEYEASIQSKVEERLAEASKAEVARIRKLVKVINDAGLPESFADSIFEQAVDGDYDEEKVRNVVESTWNSIKALGVGVSDGVFTQPGAQKNDSADGIDSLEFIKTVSGDMDIPDDKEDKE